MAAQPLPLRNHVDIWLGFDETNLYGAFFVQDTRLVQTQYGNGNPLLYRNDAIEIYVDTKNDSHDFMDANDFQLVMDAFGQVVVLRGGEKYKMKVAGWLVSKDTMTGSFVLECKAVQHGTVNKNEDTDVGYALELQIPWPSLGIQPHTGYRFKIDICLNDFDALLSANIPKDIGTLQMIFQSIGGTSDYGFPKNWQAAILHGQPSVWHRLRDLYYWPFITLSLVLVILPVLLWLGLSNRQLRQAPRQAENHPPLDQSVDPEPPPTGALPHQAMFLAGQGSGVAAPGPGFPAGQAGCPIVHGFASTATDI